MHFREETGMTGGKPMGFNKRRPNTNKITLKCKDCVMHPRSSLALAQCKNLTHLADFSTIGAHHTHVRPVSSRYLQSQADLTRNKQTSEIHIFIQIHRYN